VKKRPCRVCGCWFEPNPRAGDRQHTCPKPDCQRERNRKACRRWRARCDTKEQRLRKKIRAAKAESPEDSVSPVTPQQWDTVRHAVPAEVVVVLQEVVRLLEIWTRHAVTAKSEFRAQQVARLLPDTQRRSTAPARGPP
jgi:hypothetical protein